MDKVIEKAEELRKEVNELPEVKEYMLLKSLLESNSELAELRTNITRLGVENKLEEKKNLEKIYNENPLVVNFNAAKEEVKEILESIKQILSE